MGKEEPQIVKGLKEGKGVGGQKISSQGRLTMSCKALCCCIFFTGAILSFILSTILLFGVENYHKVDPVKIYEVFETPKYALTNELLDNTKYLILYGEAKSGIINFIEHEANLRVIEGKPVIIRQLEENIIKKHLKETKHFVEMYLGQVGRGHHSWFILLNDTETPTHQISDLQRKYPHDTIVLLTPKQLEIEGFTTLKFPALKLKQLKDFMEKDLDMDKKEVKQIIDQSASKQVNDIFVSYKNHELEKIRAAQEAERLKRQQQEEERRLKQEEERRKIQEAERQEEKKKRAEQQQAKQQKSKKQKASKKQKGKTDKSKKQKDTNTQNKQQEVKTASSGKKESKKSKSQEKKEKAPKKKSAKKEQNIQEKFEQQLQKTIEQIENKAEVQVESTPVTIETNQIKKPDQTKKTKNKKNKKEKENQVIQQTVQTPKTEQPVAQIIEELAVEVVQPITPEEVKIVELVQQTKKPEGKQEKKGKKEKKNEEKAQVEEQKTSQKIKKGKKSSKKAKEAVTTASNQEPIVEQKSELQQKEESKQTKPQEVVIETPVEQVSQQQTVEELAA